MQNSPCFVRLDSAVFVAQKPTEESSIYHREATFGVFQSECYNKTKSGHICNYVNVSDSFVFVMQKVGQLK